MAVVGVAVAEVGVGGGYAKSPKQKRPIFQTARAQEIKRSWPRRSRCHKSKTSARTDLRISRHLEVRISGNPEVMSSRPLELMSPRTHDFEMSDIHDLWRARLQAVLIS